jgi:hypothetical protein
MQKAPGSIPWKTCIFSRGSGNWLGFNVFLVHHTKKFRLLYYCDVVQGMCNQIILIKFFHFEKRVSGDIWRTCETSSCLILVDKLKPDKLFLAWGDSPADFNSFVNKLANVSLQNITPSVQQR